MKRNEALIRTDCSALGCFVDFDFSEAGTFDDCAFVFNPSYRDCSQWISPPMLVKCINLSDKRSTGITTKIQQFPMIQIVSTLLKPIRQKYPPAPSPSDADPPKMGHTDGQSHHPR